MDLIPKPDQVVSAATNVTRLVRHGGLADLRPMPRVRVAEGRHGAVHHYRPDGADGERGDPVLLVPSLAAPATCFDLRRGCSLVENLVGGGRPTYLVDHADAPLADRSLDMERWVVDVLPWAVDEVRRHAGGRPVHLVGWGVGAVLALLVAADRSGPPIGSVTSLGAPVDVTLVPAVAPFRPFLDVAGERTGLVSHAYRLLAGGAPPLVRRAFQLSAVNRLVSRPMAIAAGLDDADFLAQVEAVGRFTQQTVPYPGRAYGRTYHLLLEGHDLAGGTIALGDREISLADLTAPLLAIAGAADGIAPVESVRPLVDLTSGVDDLRFEVVPGGHLGLLTGRAARRTTWPLIDEWLSDHSSTVARTRPARRPAGRSAAPRAASREAIGSNPRRRYGSASSRTLAPR